MKQILRYQSKLEHTQKGFDFNNVYLHFSLS